VHLTQEGPERDYWGKDAVIGLDTVLAHEIDNVLNRQHGAEWAGALLEEPVEQALYLCQSSTSDRMPHGRPPSRLRMRVHPLLKTMWAYLVYWIYSYTAIG
jgi:hypothetical protein